MIQTPLDIAYSFLGQSEIGGPGSRREPIEHGFHRAVPGI